MIDMSDVIVAKSDQINAADLVSAPRTVTIVKVRKTGEKQAVEITIQGDSKFWRPCKTVLRLLCRAWGNDGEQWVGRSATLVFDPNVRYGKDETGGIRISHVSHISDTISMALQERKGVMKTFVIKPLAIPAQRTATPAATGAGVSPNDGADAGAAPMEPSQAAFDWVTATIREVAAAETIADLAQLQAAKAKGLARLEAFPKLHSDVLASFADRRAALDAAPADGEWGE